MIPITPTANLAAGSVVKITDNLTVITHQPIAANSRGYATTRGLFEIDITAGTAYNVGDLVTAPAVTLAGAETTAVIGPAVEPVSTADTTARVMLEGVNTVEASAASAG